MEITWLGHAAFRLSQRGKATVVTDPYDPRVAGYKALRTRADVVTVSQPHPAHHYVKGLRGVQRVLDRPGEYEIGDVFIIGIQLTPRKKKIDPLKEPRVLFTFDYDGLLIAHLGALDRVPSQSEIEAIGPIHVALVPVGGGPYLNASAAAEVVSLLEPNIVIPMAYRTPGSTMKDLAPVDRFLKEMGISQVQPRPSLKLRASQVPNETQVVVLEAPTA
ncbi:MAG: MBL fold metallo-hydrolase [Chloroflexi bacterium]|nr:MBL fold metallo-hydrolase [Chloroflexota bacterium]